MLLKPHLRLACASIALIVSSALPGPAFAEEPVLIGAWKCRIVDDTGIEKENVTWKGACKDGYAEGPGVVEWDVRRTDFRYQVSLLHGRFEVAMQHGRPMGAGYMESARGTRYEGNFDGWELNGKGVSLGLGGDLYEGDWKAGEKDGNGTITYGDGGGYSGQWRAGKFHGQGRATYAGGRVAEGQFVDGLREGQSPPAVPPKRSKAEREMRSNTNNSDGFIYAGRAKRTSPWSALSDSERQSVRRAYALLHEDDTPPYPLKGFGQFVDAAHETLEKVEIGGPLIVSAMIDSAGNASAVKVYASPDPRMTEAIRKVFLEAKYSPGLCAGTPCAMPYPISFEIIPRR